MKVLDRLHLRLAGGFVARIVGAVFAFASAVLLARLMSPGDYAAFTGTLALASIGGVVAGFGLDQVSVRSLAVPGRPQQISRFSGATILSALITVGVPTVFLIAAGAYGANQVFDQQFPVVAGGLALGIAVSRVTRGFLQARALPTFGLIIENAVPNAAFVALILLFPATSEPLVAVLLFLVCHLASGMIGQAVYWLRVPRPTPEFLGQVGTAITSGGILMSMMLANVALNSVDIVLIGWALPDAPAGDYAVAWRISNLGTLILYSMGALIAGDLAEAIREAQLEEAQRLTSAAARVGFALGAAFVIGGFLTAPFLIPLLFGSTYGGSVILFHILLAGFFVAFIAGPGSMVLQMANEEAVALRLAVIALSVQGVLMILELAMGADIVVFAGTRAAILGAWSISLAWAAWRKTGIQSIALTPRSIRVMLSGGF